jgi:pimeloyl-ACP methyl ester carboxylesterase
MMGKIMKSRVVMLPGLGSPGWSMSLLACRLRAAGFETSTVPYRSCWSSIEDIRNEVSKAIGAALQGDISLVCHSMGGLVARRLAEYGIPGIRIRRVVMIGTPLLGNKAAQCFAGLPLQAFPFGKLWPALSPDGCARNGDAIDGIDIGMIAGAVPGGRWIGGQDTDGIVTVPATMGDGLTDHAVVPASHASLLLSGKVAALTGSFLANGQFPKY